MVTGFAPASWSAARPEIEPSKWMTLWWVPLPVSTITTAVAPAACAGVRGERRAATDRDQDRGDGDRDARRDPARAIIRIIR